MNLTQLVTLYEQKVKRFIKYNSGKLYFLISLFVQICERHSNHRNHIGGSRII